MEVGKMKQYSIGSVRVQLIREKISPVRISETKDIIKRFNHLENCPKEHFWVLFLDGRNKLLAEKLVGLGTSNGAAVDIQDIVRTAILLNAQSVIYAHNHPSGEPHPSQDDINIFEENKKALSLLNIKLLDSVIIGHGKGFSLANDEEVSL